MRRVRAQAGRLLFQFVPANGAVSAPCFHGVKAAGVIEKQLLVQGCSALRIAFSVIEDERQLEDGIVGEDVVKMQVDYFLQPVLC